MRIHAWVFALVACVAVSSAHAQFTNSSTVLDGSGTVSSGGGYTNISAAGQPGGIAESSGGGYVNQAGFLNTFVLKPGLDTDGDGLANELDQDNDNDQLGDAAEIAGAGFSPTSPTLVNVADTDGDGMADGFESVSGTDPNDLNAHLRFVAISNSASGRDVAWLARGNSERTYVVRTAPAPGLPLSTVIFSNTLAGGAAPWFAITTTLVHASASNTQFYAVEVRP